MMGETAEKIRKLKLEEQKILEMGGEKPWQGIGRAGS